MKGKKNCNFLKVFVTLKKFFFVVTRVGFLLYEALLCIEYLYKLGHAYNVTHNFPIWAIRHKLGISELWSKGGLGTYSESSQRDLG